MDQDPQVDRLIEIFDGLFKDSLNTVLVRGEGEPIYLPADGEHPHHRVIFAHGFFASALHEIAHWCVAGPERRLLEDFGYWYKPDGRTEQEQDEFERVEVSPQAYEWILTVSAGRKFHFSADNLSQGIGASESFKESVAARARHVLVYGMNARLSALSEALRNEYQQPPLNIDQFTLEPGCVS
jgi:elongation factor P hydroxylase